jgi:hypothetical protein
MVSYAKDPLAGYAVAFNVTSPTVIKTGQGIVAVVSVIVAGSTAGAVHDAASTGATSVANQIAAIPTNIGVLPIRLPVNSGLTVIPGTGQVLAVAYS